MATLAVFFGKPYTQNLSKYLAGAWGLLAQRQARARGERIPPEPAAPCAHIPMGYSPQHAKLCRGWLRGGLQVQRRRGRHGRREACRRRTRHRRHHRHHCCVIIIIAGAVMIAITAARVITSAMLVVIVAIVIFLLSPETSSLSPSVRPSFLRRKRTRLPHVLFELSGRPRQGACGTEGN